MIKIPKEPILSGEAISKLIPQKPPIEMVDKLWYNDESTTISGLSITADNMFCVADEFTEPGLVENIAQTAALRMGYMTAEKEKAGERVEPPVGYIGAVKKLSIRKLPKVGQELVTKVVVTNMVFGVTIISGEVSLNGESVAECEMKIFLKD